MKTVCILSRGERGEGSYPLSAHPDVNTAKARAREYAYEGTIQHFPLLDWKREGNRWLAISTNGVDYLEIHKMDVEPRG
jgi:hypothetical protein